MRLIDTEAKINMLLYDEEHEEQITREMTVKEALDLYTEDGCPTTIDAEPIRHGKWIECESEEGVYFRKCSVCRHRDMYQGSFAKWGVGGFSFYFKRRYCPFCGARMDKEDL